MKVSFALVGACATFAIASPVALPGSAEAELVERDTAAAAAACKTQYCSVDAGCVCTNWPKNCSAFYTVQPGDICYDIAEKFGNFTVTQMYKWNPYMGQTCGGLQAYVPVCINQPGYKFTPPVQPPAGTHYTPDQTPVPIMPNITSNCTSFELIKSGQTVKQLAKQNHFNASDFPVWNGNSTTAWANYWACVSVS